MFANTHILGVFLGALLSLILPGRVVASCCQEPAPASARAEENYVQAGWNAFECGDLEAADALFCAAARSGTAEGWLGQAEVARRRGSTADAIFAFREYLSRAPEDEARRLDFALLLSWEGMYVEAEFEFRRLERESEDSALRAAARRGLADALAWSGRHREAERLYRLELANDPANPALMRALGELESWHARDGSAAAWFDQSLALQQDGATRAQAQRSSDRLRSEAFVQLQAFADDADWRRNKALLGASGQLFPESRPDARSTFAVEYATFEDASGRDLARRSLIVRHRERPGTFSALEFDVAYGDVRGEQSWRGGVLAEKQLRDQVLAWASIRRDDWADPIAAHPFDRYNGAFTVNLLRSDIVQATTLRGGMRSENARGVGMLAELQGGPIEDGNGRLEAYLQTHRNREYDPGRHSIPRFFYHHLGFAESSALYYSPENLDSWGVGWRWEAKEADWNAFGDAALFWQAGGVSDYGIQLGAGVEREFDAGFLLRLEANFLSTDDRGASDRYEAYAVMASVVIPF